jgi:phosphoglycerate dehydrogenase-like enzyme
VPSLRDESTRVAVASRSFSRHEQLRAELLARFSQVTFNDAGESLAGRRLVEFLLGNERAIIALETVDEALLAQLPELRVISKYGVGLDNLDLAALARHGVQLGWRRGVNSRSVAELVIAMTLISLRHLHAANDEVRQGKWRQHVGPELRGRVIGVVGLGSVGMFDSGRLDRLKRGAILINTARGGIVDESAVQALLETGRLGAAAFDVFATEPPQSTELLKLPNFFATPHLGGSSVEAILAMGRAAIDGLDAATDARSFAGDKKETVKT